MMHFDLSRPSTSYFHSLNTKKKYSDWGEVKSANYGSEFVLRKFSGVLMMKAVEPVDLFKNTLTTSSVYEDDIELLSLRLAGRSFSSHTAALDKTYYLAEMKLHPRIYR